MTRRAGFTLIELTVTIVVAGLILSLVGRALGDVQRRLAAQQAMKTFEALQARTRAHAIERGTEVDLVLDTDGDSASIVLAGRVLETIHFRSELGVDVWSNASSNPVTVCLNPRGYGDPSCMSFTSVINVYFGAGSDTVSLHMLPLGQIVR